MTKEENDIRISRYLDGEMSREEELAFEKAVSANESLQEDLNLHLELEKVIHNREVDQNYTSYLDKFRKRYQQQIDKPFISRNNLLISGVILIIAIIVTLISFVRIKPVNGPELFARYYEPYELTSNYRSSGDLEMDRGLRSYNNGNYNDALVFFENMLEVEPFNAKAHFTAGISALEVNQNKKAVEHFTKILESDNLEFYQHAQWYLALAYLKIKHVQQAQVLLIALRNTGGYYHKKASEIIDQLN